MSEEPKILASISGGKDSLAALITHIESGGRCDGAVYCRIMFDDETSAEYPEHEDFLFNKCFPTLEREFGIKTAVVQGKETYKEHFYRQFKRGKKIGQIYGFPSLWCPWCNSDLKVKPLESYKQKIGEYVSITGIAADEKRRINRKNGKNGKGKIRPLIEHGIREADTFGICKRYGLLSPGYSGGRERLGCWFCHNQRLGELKRLFYDYPELWKELEELQQASRLKFTPRYTVGDLAQKFSSEGFQMMLGGEGASP